MKNFITVIQTKHNTFDVCKFSAETSKSIYPQSSKIGITIAVFESNKQNDAYCFELANELKK